MLFTENLFAGYNGRNILNGVSLKLDKGELVCLCGRNGAGKSTLLSVLAGLQNESLKIKADVLPNIDGSFISKMPLKEKSKKIAFMSQTENFLWDFSVYDVVLSGRYPYSRHGYYSKEDENIAENVLEEMNLSDFAERSILALSGGELQKVRIARSLSQSPDYLILDEPAAGLDFVYEHRMMNLLLKLSHEKNMGIILSVHDINLAAKLADRLVFLPPFSKEIAGTAEEVFNPDTLKKTFSEDFIVYSHEILKVKQSVLK